MKKLKPFVFFVLTLVMCPKLQAQTWLHLDNVFEYVEIGDLDIAGDQLTIEAKIYQQQASYGDIVSKHAGCSDQNYLLRPYGGSVSTSNGCFNTPVNCGAFQQFAELNECLHVAMVYDGNLLRHYINGFLNAQIAASGNLLQNNWSTKIGMLGAPLGNFFQEQFYGYIDEVRIWNVARTQSEIRANMLGSLPNPTSQTGLLAYYRFNSLTNLAGNPMYDGTLVGSGTLGAQDTFCTPLGGNCYTLLNAHEGETSIPKNSLKSEETRFIQEAKKLSIQLLPDESSYFQVQVFDLKGRQLFAESASLEGGQTKEIHWQANMVGLYFLKINHNGKEQVHKVLMR